ncbi:MAG: M23 family metallopeptidase [Omnitrophica bacterium]|nr:M23 family metallopeptidase [Candidatus Omnitrophota bacterium]
MTKKNVLGLSLAIPSILAFILLLHEVFFPFVYNLKEPFFAVPIEVSEELSGAQGLPIRNDEQGDGWFGAKRNGNRKHLGLDLAAKLGSPVYAAKSGWARISNVPDGYGKLVLINHPGHWQTRYGHLSEFAVKKLQWVRQGDVIGFIGKTGNAGSSDIVSHLHFEIRRKSEPLDPARELVKN